MIRRNNGRSKFISLLMVLTMVFSMIMPMGVWAAGGGLSIDPTTVTFTPVNVGYPSVTAQPVTVSTTTGAQTNVTVVVSTDKFLINGAVTTTPAVIAASLTTTPATFTIKPKDGLSVGSYTATVTVKSNEDSTGVSFNVTQVVNSTGQVSTNISEIKNPANKMIVGDYLVDLTNGSDKFITNNFIKMAQTAYDSNTSGYPIYEIYYHDGSNWINLVKNEVVTDISKMNGTGKYKYTDVDLKTYEQLFGAK